MPLTHGEKLGPYEIIALIGAGGMGEVYRATDTRLDRDVAIKVSTERFTERFEREARVIASLNHPNICRLYDVGPNYLVMEFVEGPQLKGPLPVRKAIEYSGQILDALDAAHKKGITHRDLKPANILVTKQGIKLLDFGLAHIAVEGDNPTLTRTGAVMGTPAYIAPEQWDGHAPDSRADIYAFGCVLHELLTGKLAAKERSPVQPASLENILRTCLENDPDDRWQTARDLKRNLISAAEQPTVAEAQPSRIWPWVAAATLVLGALSGWVIARFSTPSAHEPLLRLQISAPEGGRFLFGNNVGGIALSPDGKTAAYVATVGGKTAVWVRPLDTGTPRMLVGTNVAAYPFWSPDGKSIGYFTSNDVQRVDIAGGAPQKICEVSVGRGAAWTTDGRILVGSLSSGLLQCPASGGVATPVTTVDTAHGETAHRWPQLLPGDRFLYWSQSTKSGIYAASFAKPGEATRVLDSDANALYASGSLLWLRGGTLVAQQFDARTFKLTGDARPIADSVAKIGVNGNMDAAVSDNGLLLYSASNISSQFQWFDKTGKVLGTIGEPAENEAFRLSPDGRRIASGRDRPGIADIWIWETERGVANPFTFTSISTYPVWSPNANTLVFNSGAPRNLFRKDVAGRGEPQRLFSSPMSQFPTDWSSDGNFILYYEIAPRTQRDLWYFSLKEGKPSPYLVTPATESWGRFSPDTHWVAYQSDVSGRYEIYVQSFPVPRGEFRISTAGGQFPAWGSSGKELFYVSPENKLIAVNLKAGTQIEVMSARELFALPSADIGWPPFDVAADGRLLIRATPQQGFEPLNVIANWPSLQGTPSRP